MKTALVLGAGGFIGGAMCKRLKEEGYWVRGVDLKNHEFANIEEIVDEFVKTKRSTGGFGHSGND